LHLLIINRVIVVDSGRKLARLLHEILIVLHKMFVEEVILGAVEDVVVGRLEREANAGDSVRLSARLRGLLPQLLWDALCDRGTLLRDLLVSFLFTIYVLTCLAGVVASIPEPSCAVLVLSIIAIAISRGSSLAVGRML